MNELQPDIAIRVRDLVVAFGKHTVLDHLSLDVRRAMGRMMPGSVTATKRSLGWPGTGTVNRGVARTRAWW